MSDADKPSDPAQPIEFEATLAELETLVGQMEEGGLTLEQSLGAFERGIGLVRQCQQALDAAERRIEILTAQGIQPFAAEPPDDDQP